MKKFILMMTIALGGVFASCTKVNDLSEIDSMGKESEVLFSTKATFKTKTIVEGTDMVDNFGVYGYVFPGAYTVDGGYLMKNAEFDPTGVAANDAHYYWPKSDNNETVNVLFTAYSQYDSNVVFNADSTVTITVPEFTQGLIDNPSNFNDVLWAQTGVNRHQSAIADSAHYRVPLHFRHALSWLQFRAEVSDSTGIKWVQIDTVKFGAWDEGQAAVYDTTKYYNIAGSYNATVGGFQVNVGNTHPYLPAAIRTKINEVYELNKTWSNAIPTPSNNMGISFTGVYELIIHEDKIPSGYAKEIPGIGVVFNSNKYIKDELSKLNATYEWFGSLLAQSTDDDWLFVHFDDNVDTTTGAYRVNFDTNAYFNNNYTDNNLNGKYLGLVENYILITPGTQGHILVDSLAVGGTLTLPTNTLADSPVLTNADKVAADFNFVTSQVDTLHGRSYSGIHEELLSSSLVLPQAVPEHITIIFTICVKNPAGDDVIISGRRITRKINTAKDSDNHDYVSSWLSGHRYIYNFKIDVDKIDFNVSVDDWTAESTDEFHVWNY